MGLRDYPRPPPVEETPRRVQVIFDYLILHNCPYCQGIHNAPRPVCFATVRYHEVLLLRLTGQPVIVRELECRATGHERCMFAVRRERTLPGVP